MKKSKADKKKLNDFRTFSATYLTAVNRNLELINENTALIEEIKQLKGILTTEPGNRKYLIRLKMHTNSKEAVFDFTSIIQLIQFNSPELLVKILRQVHHNYSVLNIQEMTAALNNQPSLATYSESIPNELNYLKGLADAVEQIKEAGALNNVCKT